MTTMLVLLRQTRSFRLRARLRWGAATAFSTSGGSDIKSLSNAVIVEKTKRPSSRIPPDGKALSDFFPSVGATASDLGEEDLAPHYQHQYGMHEEEEETAPLKFHLQTYGCQMNVNDTDIIRSILLNEENNMIETRVSTEADVVLINTCAIRENAEKKIWNRLAEMRSWDNKQLANKKDTNGPQQQQQRKKRVIGVLGCMAERLKEEIFENKKLTVDLIAGPDAYRDLPRLIQSLFAVSDDTNKTAANVQLSMEETYAEIRPVRSNPGDVSAFVSVMRGCNNMCSYCVVPFTRGRERSRDLNSIVNETNVLLQEENIKEVVLLGQNVNSYHDKSSSTLIIGTDTSADYHTSNPGFTNMYKKRGGKGHYFSDLVAAVSDLSPELRIRFTSPHPKDYPPELLQLMAERHNVCNQLHMPAQSGSTQVLQRMRRGYSQDAYLELIRDVKDTINDVAISSDFIAGFCGETEQDHMDTLSLMEIVKYDQAFMFKYSERGKTHAMRRMEDDVPEDVKGRRLSEIIDVFRTQVQIKNQEEEIGRLRLVLVEGTSRRSTEQDITWSGRTDQNKRIMFKDTSVLLGDAIRGIIDHPPLDHVLDQTKVAISPGDFCVVEVTEARGHTLRGRALFRATMQQFYESKIDKSHERFIASNSILHSPTSEEKMQRISIS